MPRKRSPHPGIIVLPARPEKRQGASIRYVDPDTGKERTERLPEGAGREWLIRRSTELAGRRQALRDGAARITGNALEQAITSYYKEVALRPSTVKMYELSTNQLKAWGGVSSGDDLTLAKLRELRAWLLRLPGRGPESTNRDLRTIAAFLEHSRKAGRCARLSSDSIRDGLVRVRTNLERKSYLAQPADALVDSSGDLELQSFVAFLLLTGMRAGEALALKVGAIDWGAACIRLQGSETKTGLWRTVELGWTPLGYLLCEVLAAGKEPHQLVFTGLTKQIARSRRRELVAPWDYQELRRTCSTFLCSMPSVGLWRAAKSLGHHPDIARKHYAGVVRTEERFLEGAMKIASEVRALLVKLREHRRDSLPAGALVRHVSSRVSARPGRPGALPD